MADRDDSTDRGFTLIETIVVVLMVAVLSSVIVAVIAVILRNVPTTEARADDSRSYQRLSLWLPRDAASTPPNRFDLNDPPGSASCAGATGVNLVHMSWQGNPSTEVAEYRLVPDGPGVKVERVTCSGPAYSDTETIDVTSTLHDAAAAPQIVGGKVVGVALTLTTCMPSNCSVGDATIIVTGGSRNPLQALPTTTTSSTTTTSTTTTTTTSIP